MKHGFHIWVLTTIAAGLSLGMGSCSTPREEACRNKIPNLQKRFAQMSLEVAALAPEPSNNRAIASVSSGDPAGETARPADRNQVFPIDRDVKDHLQQWSEDRLVETESYEDIVRGSSELRPAVQPLSDLAGELIKIDGYAETGRVYQLMAALRRAEIDADAAVRAVCGSVSVSTVR